MGREIPDEEYDGTTIDEDPPTAPGPNIVDPLEPPIEPRKFYVDTGKVSISAHVTQDLDAEGRQLRVSEFRDHTSEVERSLFTDVADFRHGWADPDRRNEILVEAEDQTAGDAAYWPIYNLVHKNPNSVDALEHRPPEELVDSILDKEREILRLMEEVKLKVADLESGGRDASRG